MSDRVCCEPCQDQGYCRPSSNCCVECHFSFEEQVAMPYLPRHLQEQLVYEHQWLLAHGQPKQQVLDHAEREMQWFRHYCPPEVVAQIDRDHHYYEHGMLHSRENR